MSRFEQFLARQKPVEVCSPVNFFTPPLIHEGSALYQGNIFLGAHPCLLGWAHIGVTDLGVCQISFADSSDITETKQRLVRTWPRAHIIDDASPSKQIVNALFKNPLESKFEWPLLLNGTEFQKAVWRALVQVQPGTVCSYADLAAKVGKPKAVRAVASAVGANPIGYLIPCHRIIRSDGGLGGFRWGLERKQALLHLESTWELTENC